MASVRVSRWGSTARTPRTSGTPSQSAKRPPSHHRPPVAPWPPRVPTRRLLASTDAFMGHWAPTSGHGEREEGERERGVLNGTLTRKTCLDNEAPQVKSRSSHQRTGPKNGGRPASSTLSFSHPWHACASNASARTLHRPSSQEALHMARTERISFEPPQRKKAAGRIRLQPPYP